MTRNVPLRRTILHLGQRRRTEAETFMSYLLVTSVYRLVKISASPFVMARVCSKCAESDPSAATTVH